MKQITISSLREGVSIEAPFLIKQKKLLPFKTKQGKFLHLLMGDKTGEIEGRLWETAEEIYPDIKDHPVLNIQGEVVNYNGSLQINIKTVSICKEYSPKDFLPESPRDKKQMINELNQHIQSINNPFLKNFLLKLFTGKLLEKFSLAPAAKFHHQAYLCGLLEHTLNVTKICDGLSKTYPEVDRDLLLTGALIHDIGKTEELSYDYNIDYTDHGRMLGHLVIGSHMVKNIIEKIPDFPKELSVKLLHMVISHHGQYEWQSPKKPKFLEAALLHHADLIDAQVDKFIIAKNQADDEETWSDWMKGLDRYVYLK